MITNKPLYMNIVAAIQQQINAGEYRIGERFYSVSELQKAFRVSSTTAVAALNELKKDGLISSIKGKGSYIAAIAVPRVAATLPDKLRGIAVLSVAANFVRGGYQKLIYEGIEIEAAGKNIPLRMETLPFEATRDPSITPYNPREGDGVIMIGGHLTMAMCLLMLNRHIKTVFIDSLLTNSCCVMTDNLDGVHKLINCLRNLGHTRFLMAAGNPYSPNASNENERMAAFNFFIKQYGLSGEIMTGEAGKKIIGRVRERNAPTAVMFNQDDPALEFMIQARQAGLRIPGNVSVTGFDGFANRHEGLERLTTLQVDRQAMGAAAVRALLDMNGQNEICARWIRVPGKLITGESTGTPSAPCKPHSQRSKTTKEAGSI